MLFFRVASDFFHQRLSVARARFSKERDADAPRAERRSCQPQKNDGKTTTATMQAGEHANVQHNLARARLYATRQRERTKQDENSTGTGRASFSWLPNIRMVIA